MGGKCFLLSHQCCFVTFRFILFPTLMLNSWLHYHVLNMINYCFLEFAMLVNYSFFFLAVLSVEIQEEAERAETLPRNKQLAKLWYIFLNWILFGLVFDSNAWICIWMWRTMILVIKDIQLTLGTYLPPYELLMNLFSFQRPLCLVIT